MAKIALPAHSLDEIVPWLDKNGVKYDRKEEPWNVTFEAPMDVLIEMVLMGWADNETPAVDFFAMYIKDMTCLTEDEEAAVADRMRALLRTHLDTPDADLQVDVDKESFMHHDPVGQCHKVFRYEFEQCPEYRGYEWLLKVSDEPHMIFR